ncbi:DEAD/DEAH box helicase family protein [Alteriqipengyuania sp. WL0013]|uniref:DEAD/DEAH box helicase family protein n=1 Tax=Alteriqipengyuania sp. WL0013 TaxID=3110773 RepID=UPI002CABEAAE|nr:DEAD/DEAH box helicase family protein [Alteriqipengyuania sp. WL0013]MEB3415003.1 DEAD/DEAH box helicase family protein [Alteriqipengyuania sp. WL0013]
MARAPRKKRSFHQELVLNRWMLGFFHGGSLDALKERLGADRHEGLEDDGQTKFFHELTRNLFNLDRIDEAQLRRYDLNIVKHWQSITHRRNAVDGHVLTMKYFQYLSLLFTEIYLDWYFARRQDLLDGLNAQMAEYRKEDGSEPFRDYTADDLNKLAFWNATGSGKTLLLHVNIHQYLHYFQEGNGKSYPDKIILLTPNEGLSRQHLDELALSGFSFTRLFDKNRSPDFPGTIEVIDINKLGDDMGDKTVAVEAFEGNNLVLVDEGHRGAGSAGGAWMARREALVSKGFAFEYSATFGQAVNKGLTIEKAEEDLKKAKAKLLDPDRTWRQWTQAQRDAIVLDSRQQRRAKTDAVKEAYAKAVLFDYSYKFFYADGYGKESLILNLDEKDDEEQLAKYFTACLLAFYQQLYLWDTQGEKIADFNIAKPLWVFVGNKVADDDSDILAVVRFLGEFLDQQDRSKRWIDELVNDRAQLLDPKGNNIFARKFVALLGQDAEAIFADILRRLFNAGSRQRLKLVNLKGSAGELALQVGTEEPFGLINIGNDSGFFKTADNEGEPYDAVSDDFGSGLFETLNDKGSKLNILIGSRKFTEGWSSWRVSTMGLLNMGQGEGTQIIQLFGRGVRLKGRAMSLKRSTPAERQQLAKGAHLETLETLNIFGVRASYMATFKDYLREEGITPSDEMLELDFPTKSNLPAGKRLKTLKLKDGYKDNQAKGFKRTHYPTLYDLGQFEGRVKKPHITLDLYPRVEALATNGPWDQVPPAQVRHEGKLSATAMASFDWDAIYLAVQEYKLLRTWSNLRLDQDRLKDFCTTKQDWYTLYAPASELEVRTVADIQKQQSYLIRLLIDYTDRFYQALKGAYEGQFFQTDYIDEQHGSMLDAYRFEIKNTDEGATWLKRLQELQAVVAAGDIEGAQQQWADGPLIAISFKEHLYYPLMSPADGHTLPLRMRPIAFDAPSEVQFVRDLEGFCASEVGKDLLAGKSLYLLRNADTKSKGLGFATAGNFYPDFLLWMVDEKSGQQWLSFVDPKGIKLVDLSDPKLQLYREIKDIEEEVGDPLLTLNAFILSNTAFENLLNIGDRETQADLEDRHLLFMNGGRDRYLTQLITKTMQAA